MIDKISRNSFAFKKSNFKFSDLLLTEADLGAKNNRANSPKLFPFPKVFL